MIRTYLMIACLCSLTAAGCAKNDSDSLVGTWKATSIEANGKTIKGDDASRMEMQFKPDTLIIKGSFGDDREESCTWKIDVSKSPKTLDFTPGKHDPVLAIYELNGDELKICFIKESKERPKEMSASKQTLITLKRAK